VVGDGRSVAQLLPEQFRGQVALVVTSPPYGANTHGQVDARSGGKVTKDHYKYTESRRGSSNLAHADLEALVAGFTDILRGCEALLRPGGHVVITTRPWRRAGALIDLPGMTMAAATATGLVPVERCIALLARVNGSGLITRPSLFQLTAVRNARAAGVPLHVIAHEDVLVLRKPGSDHPGSQESRNQLGNPERSEQPHLPGRTGQPEAGEPDGSGRAGSVPLDVLGREGAPLQ
jgi:hypothetical protein